MKIKTTMKLVVNRNILLNDLQKHIGNFLNQSLKFGLNLGTIIDLSFKVSYTSDSGKTVYILVHTEYAPKRNLNTAKIAESIVLRLNDRKIYGPKIKSLHAHLLYG